MFSQPLKPIVDWAFKILYFLSRKSSAHSCSLIIFFTYKGILARTIKSQKQGAGEGAGAAEQPIFFNIL